MGLNMLCIVLRVIKGSSKWRKASKCQRLMKQLKNRLAYLKIRRSAIVRQSREDIAQLRGNGQHQAALSRVKQLYSDQCRISAYNQLEGYCDYITANIHHLSQTSKMSVEVLEAVASLIFAASRCGELPELHAIRNLFRQRYGQKFDKVNVELQLGNTVNSQLKHNFITTITRDVMQNLIEDVDKEYKLDLMQEGNQPNKLHEKVTNDESIDLQTHDNGTHKDQIEASTLESMLQKIRRLFPIYADSRTQWRGFNNSIPGHELNSSETRSANLTCKSRNEKIIIGDRSKAGDKVYIKDAKSGRSLTSRCLSPRRRAQSRSKNDKEGGLRPRPSHVHPKLPDHDELVKEFMNLKKK